MGLSGEGEPEVFCRYQDLCADLNMDKNAAEEAWQAFQRISTNYTLEGDRLHWLACAVYVACRKGMVPTVGRSSFIEGNCVSLTRLLRTCKLSLVQFFNKMKKWADMANLPQDMRNKVDRLERNFNVSTVIYKKFEPIFRDVFVDPSVEQQPRPSRCRKIRRYPCTPSEVFSFCWTLFARVKGIFPAISDDLVNSYHLLLCCLDLFFSNALMSDRRDLLNPTFAGLPETYHNKDYRPVQEPPCIIELLCKNHEGLVVEAKGIKEHWWKPHIKRLLEKKTLKGKVETLSGILEPNCFEANRTSINKEYEIFVLNVGDFDERIFLGENASEEIGTPTRQPYSGTAELTQRMQMKLNLKQHMEETRTLRPLTPLTGRKYLKDKDVTNITPVSTATQSVSRLQALLAGRKSTPSDTLMEIFRECSRNPQDTIKNRVKEMGEIFCTSYAQPSDDHPGSHIDFAKKRLQLGESLYYKALENIMQSEKKRLPPNMDLSGLVEHDTFHKSLFACCLEIVIFSYNSQRSFPWILEAFDLQPYDFYKVIELLIRAEEGLSRDVVKHLNHIEEQILENLAWKSESTLWDAIKTSGLSVPSCEDVSLPFQTEAPIAPAPPPQLVSSPLAHPAFRRLNNLEKPIARRDSQSPAGLSVTERFQSPTPGATSTARRKLFMTERSGVVGTGIPVSSAEQSVTAVSTSAVVPATVMSPGRTVSITLHSVQNNNAIAYIPISTITVPTQIVPAAVMPSPALGDTAPQTSAIMTPPVPGSSAASTPNNTPKESKQKRIGSVGLFFRKVYHLAGVRLKDLCDRLSIMDDESRQKIWTCFEYTVMQHIDLMCDRHLDQLLMCAVYVICKVTKEDRSFQEIMKCYRFQPQAASHVYRSVLLKSKKRRNSGSSETSKNGSGSNSPIPGEKEEKESKRTERLSTIRSSSTLPVPNPSSQPPTPTRLAGTGTSFEFEERGDLIVFYNTVYVPKIQKFALKFSQTSSVGESPPLSPLPKLNANPMSPFRQVSSKHLVYISPMKSATMPQSPMRPLFYSFSRSPAKDLRVINNMVRMGEKKVGKRILQDDLESESPAKRLCPGLTLRKIQSVITERQGGGVAD